MNASRHDVIVVGGGPSGAAAARAAVREGASVALLERHAAPREKVCGEYLCPGAVEELARLGFAPALRSAASAPLLGMRLFSPEAEEVRTFFPVGRPGLSIRRRDLDSRLVDAAGAEVLRGAAVLDLERGAHGVSVHLEGGRTVEGAVVVGADGRTSTIARRCGLHARPRRRPRATLHAYYANVGGCASFGEMHLPGDGTYIGLNPGPDGLVNVTYVCDLEQLGSAARSRADEVVDGVVRSLPSLHLRFARAERVGPSRVLAPLEVRARRLHDDRVLLAGDAAGFLDPLTGEGMYGAVVTGALAGRWAARAALRGTTGASALAGYRLARRRALGSKAALNVGFQWLLTRPRVLEFLRRRLQGSRALGDTLIGIVGNTGRPGDLLCPRHLAALLTGSTRA